MKCPECGGSIAENSTKCPQCGKVPATPSPAVISDYSDVFRHNIYTLRRQIFKPFGSAFHIFDPSGNVEFYSILKFIKLKDDIRVYSGEDIRRNVEFRTDGKL